MKPKMNISEQKNNFPLMNEILQNIKNNQAQQKTP